MKLAYASLLTVLVGAGALLAQTPPGETTQATRAAIAGVVTKDPGSVPLKKALIELIAESQRDGGNYTALTGVDGSFHLENLVPGRYRLFVERTGYQEIDKRHRRSDGRVLTLSAGQEMKDLVIRLQAAAVVEGRVTDEDGDPMPEAQVAVLRQTFVAGRIHWEQAGAERTNDLGEYRIAGLAAGNYFVSVTPPRRATAPYPPTSPRLPPTKPPIIPAPEIAARQRQSNCTPATTSRRVSRSRPAPA